MTSMRTTVPGVINGGQSGAARWALTAALALMGAASASCTDNTTTGYATTSYAYWDPYYYSYYYPADLSYSGVYWADSWDYSAYYYSLQSAATVSQGGVGAAIRALARGEQVCPGQVTVTPKMGTPACAAAGVTGGRTGVTVVFNGCQLSGGGTVSGTYDVEATRTASETNCSASTVITLNHTTTITNLIYNSPNGGRVVVPKQVDTGGNTYNYGQPPSTVTIQSTGQSQVYDSTGALRADLGFNGTRMFTYSLSNKSYAVSGSVTAKDSVTGSNTTLNADALTRTSDCCRPTSGTLTVTSTDGNAPGQHVATFGPTCGAVTFDNNSVSLPACY